MFLWCWMPYLTSSCVWDICCRTVPFFRLVVSLNFGMLPHLWKAPCVHKKTASNGARSSLRFFPACWFRNERSFLAFKYLPSPAVWNGTVQQQVHHGYLLRVRFVCWYVQISFILRSGVSSDDSSDHLVSRVTFITDCIEHSSWLHDVWFQYPLTES